MDLMVIDSLIGGGRVMWRDGLALQSHGALRLVNAFWRIAGGVFDSYSKDPVGRDYEIAG